MSLPLILSWTEQYPGHYYGEPEAFVHGIAGAVKAIDRGDRELLAGRFGVYYVDLEAAMNAKMPMFDVMDAHQETLGYYEALYEPRTDELREAVLTQIADYPLGLNLLILDRLELLPQYRKKGAGLRLLVELMRRFSAGAGLVAMKPYPLQFECPPTSEEDIAWRERLGLAAMEKSQAKCTAKLRSHYAQLGFERVGKTPYMIRDPGLALPILSE